VVNPVFQSIACTNLYLKRLARRVPIRLSYLSIPIFEHTPSASALLTMSSMNSTPRFLVLDGQGLSSITSSQTIRTALKDAESPLANSILTACHRALLHDYASMSEDDQENCGLTPADFASPSALLNLPIHIHENAIVANIHLFLVQLLRYLAHSGSGLGVTHEPHSSLNILGFSSGILAATAIACTEDIPSCISHSVSIFRLAYWLGLRSQLYMRTMSNTSSISQATWSLVIFGSTRSEIQQAIDLYTSTHVSSTQMPCVRSALIDV
jgi:hypothetical protein